MATAQQIVTRALRRLQAIDINEQPKASEMSHGLDLLTELINAWSMDMPALAVQSMSATLVDGDATVTVEDTSSLEEGINLSGTGIVDGAYVLSITNATTFEMSEDATASGEGVTISTTPIPFPVKHEKGVIALLAVRFAEDLGMPVLPMVMADSIEGMNALLADYITTPKPTYDAALVNTSSRSVQGDISELFDS